jgi:hypothetical protein
MHGATIKNIRLWFGFILKLWTLYKPDDGLADRPRIVRKEKCNGVVQQ